MQNGDHAATPQRTRVLVAGGGLGGLAAARHLDHLLGARPDVGITLVNRDNFFLLSPLLFEACSGALELRHCAQSIRPDFAAFGSSRHRLLPESKPFLAEYARRVLRERGAELHVGTPVHWMAPGVVRWAEGEVRSSTIVLAAGIVPSAMTAAMNVSRDRRGRILTHPTLRSVSDEHVGAFGLAAKREQELRNRAAGGSPRVPSM